MGRINPPERHGGGRREAGSFGLSTFMEVQPKTSHLDDATEYLILTSLGDMFTGFFAAGAGKSPGGSSLEEDNGEDDNGDDQDVMNSGQEKAAYWNKQHQLLEAALHRSSSFEKKVRRDAATALKDVQGSTVCICSKRVAMGGCRACLQREIVRHLRIAGHDAAVCKSKWRSSPDIPAGEHSYIEVIDSSASGRADDSSMAARVLVELEFRSEFEMARGSSDYNQLVGRLPELYVGKPDRLKEVIKVVCSAGKRCMKEKKMHLGPWRRHKYMNAKWLGAYERMPEPPLIQLSARMLDDPQKKKKTSMSKFDLSRNMTNFAVVEVV